VFSLLQIVGSGSSFVFTLKLYWWPRLLSHQEQYFYDYNPVTLVRAGTKYENCLIQYLNTLSVPNTAEALAAFPSATAVANLGQGPMVRYTKTVDCNTDFVGTPVTLTKIEEYKTYSGATQSKVAAAGITNIPSTVTITPV
jgi:hypothetical protein